MSNKNNLAIILQIPAIMFFVYFICWVVWKAAFILILLAQEGHVFGSLFGISLVLYSIGNLILKKED